MVLIGYTATMIYLFFRISRCGDYFGYILASLRAPLVVLAVAVATSLFSGRFMNALLSKMGMRFILLTFIFLISSAFSVWPGGSINEFRNFWPPAMTMFLVLASFLTTATGMTTALSALGYGVGVAATYAFLFGGVDEVGRMNAGGMAYSNANDLALVMVIGIPALYFIFADPRRGMLGRLAALALLAPTLYVFVSAGSRGGLLGFVAVAAFLLWRQSWAVRMRTLAGLMVVCILVALAAPDLIMRRLTTFMVSETEVDPISSTSFGPEDGPDDNYTEIAAASAQGRWHLMKQATELMLRNPVIGVGYGMFMVAENELAVGSGRSRGSWKGTHNMYLQVGSENGLPGLFVFGTILLASWRSFRTHRRVRPDATRTERAMAHAALAFQTSMVGFLVTGFFLTVAYDYFTPMYAGLAVGLENVAALEAQRRAAADSPDDGGATQGARGQIDWTQAPVGVPAPAHLQQGL